MALYTGKQQLANRGNASTTAGELTFDISGLDARLEIFWTFWLEFLDWILSNYRNNIASLSGDKIHDSVIVIYLAGFWKTIQNRSLSWRYATFILATWWQPANVVNGHFTDDGGCTRWFVMLNCWIFGRVSRINRLKDGVIEAMFDVSVVRWPCRWMAQSWNWSWQSACCNLTDIQYNIY